MQHFKVHYTVFRGKRCAASWIAFAANSADELPGLFQDYIDLNGFADRSPRFDRAELVTDGSIYPVNG